MTPLCQSIIFLLREWNFEACKNRAFNETVTLSSYLTRSQRVFYLFWALIIGSRDAFGLIQLLRFSRTDKIIAVKKLIASLSGRILALQTK
jgi:hypothetical protein